MQQAPNIQLYNLFRHDLAALEKKIKEQFLNVDARFEKIDARFEKIDARFLVQDERLVALDKKIDVKVSDLRTEIHNAKNETNRYIFGIFLAILLSQKLSPLLLSGKRPIFFPGRFSFFLILQQQQQQHTTFFYGDS